MVDMYQSSAVGAMRIVRPSPDLPEQPGRIVERDYAAGEWTPLDNPMLAVGDTTFNVYLN